MRANEASPGVRPIVGGSQQLQALRARGSTAGASCALPSPNPQGSLTTGTWRGPASPHVVCKLPALVGAEQGLQNEE